MIQDPSVRSDPEWGEAVCALVVLEPGAVRAGLTAAELRAQGIEVERYAPADDVMIVPVEVVAPVRKRKAV